MAETVAIREEKFLRPRGRKDEKGTEKFRVILRRMIRTALLLLFLSFSLFAGHRIYTHLLEEEFFRVKQVDVKGNRKISREAILSLVRMEVMSNLLTVKLAEVAGRLESHPWIEQVRVSKVFPNTLFIQVKERKPIAILQLEELYYIDAKGVVFSSVGEKDGYDYPFLTGLTRHSLEKDSVQARHLISKALELLRTLEKEKASPFGQVSEVHVERGFGINCITQAEGIEVRMGWGQFGEKVKRLPFIWTDLQNRGISAVSIDCSDMTRVVVRTNPKQSGTNGERRKVKDKNGKGEK